MTSLATPARRAAAAGSLAAVAALAAACGSSGSPSSGSSPAPGKTVTVTASPSPAPSSSSVSTPAGPGPCPTGALGIRLGVSQGAAGSVYQVIDFTNIGTTACSLYGYPGVSLTAGKAGARDQVGLPAAEDHSTARVLVTLAPRATASALLRIVDALNYPPARCKPVTTDYIQVYPPNQTTPAYVQYRSKACSKPVRTLGIGAVRAGAGSSG